MLPSIDLLSLVCFLSSLPSERSIDCNQPGVGVLSGLRRSNLSPCSTTTRATYLGSRLPPHYPRFRLASTGPTVRMPFYIQPFTTAQITNSFQATLNNRSTFRKAQFSNRQIAISHRFLVHQLSHLDGYPKNANEDVIQESGRSIQMTRRWAHAAVHTIRLYSNHLVLGSRSSLRPKM